MINLLGRRSPFLALFVMLLSVSSTMACALQEPPGMGHEEEEHDPVDVQPAVTYSEMRLTPRGATSGLEQDLEPMRRESASDKMFFEGSGENINLARRAELRAFEGAPPVIPHTVQQNSAPECLACHGARLQFRGLAARPICHDEQTNCTACHVMETGPKQAGHDLGADPRAVANSFVGLRRQVDRVLPTAGPPNIAHRTTLRERCASCHGQNGPAEGHHPVDFELERALPKEFVLSSEGRLTCRTCHEESPALAAFTAQSATPSTVPDGSLCLLCHESAHDPVFARLGLSGGAHSGGADLDKILSQRMGTSTGTGCLGCHGTDGALQQAVLRDAGEGRVCAACHREKAARDWNHPVGAPAQPDKKLAVDLPVGEAGAPICLSCHDLAGTAGRSLVRNLEGGRSLCMDCHDDRIDAMKGPHGKTGKTGEPCAGCHQVHGAAARKHLLATTSRATAGDPMGCLACHGPGGSAATADARPGARGHPVDGRMHAGMDEPLTCGSCHDAHEPDPSKIVCGDCHEDKAADFARGGHGTAECLDCHPAHQDFEKAPLPGMNPAAQRCLACHDASVGKPGITHVADYEHPVPVFAPDGARWQPLGALPLYGANGQPVASDENGDLTCSTCHTTHAPDPTHPAEQLRRPGWQGVCSACHADNSLMVYNYFHDRSKLTEPTQ